MSNNSQEEKKHWRKEVGSQSDKERAIRRIKRIGNVIMAWTIVIACIVLLIGGIYFAVRAIGERRLRANAKSEGPDIATSTLVESADDISQEEKQAATVWQEDWIRYNGKVYEYNDKLMTFLVMGIDKQGEVSESKSATDGGQADAIFLVVANPDEKKLSLIGINRDTMVDINAVDV